MAPVVPPLATPQLVTAFANSCQARYFALMVFVFHHPCISVLFEYLKVYSLAFIDHSIAVLAKNFRNAKNSQLLSPLSLQNGGIMKYQERYVLSINMWMNAALWIARINNIKKKRGRQRGGGRAERQMHRRNG